VSALAIGIAFDLAMRSGVMGVAGSLCIFLASAALILSGRLRTRAAIACVAVAPLFGVWLSIRSSDWLIPFDVIASCALVALGASLGSGASFWDLTVPRVVARGVQAVTQLFLAPRFLIGSAQGPTTSKVFAVVRGVALAVPLLVLLAVLLASGDAVFASFVDIDIADGLLHLFLIAFGALAAGWLFRLASLSHVETPAMQGPRVGSTEWMLVLGSLNVLLGAFAIARLVALSEGGRRVISSAGLTYAEYARSGFFQLVGAALVTTLALLALRAVADLDHQAHGPLFKALALGVVVFTLLIVVTAFHRLVLYESVFGLTMLRVYVQTATVGIAIFLVMLGAVVLGVRRDRAWLWPAAGIVALGLLFALNVFNPEAFVARYNIEHATETAQFDTSYLHGLSDDVLPVLAEHGRIPPVECESTDRIDGWASYNVSVGRADAIRSQVCTTTRGG
jgi:hypothetical protein